MLKAVRRECVKPVNNGEYKARVLHYEDSPEALVITFALEGVTYKHHPARIRLTNAVAYDDVTFYDKFFSDVLNQLGIDTDDDIETLEYLKEHPITLYAFQNGQYTNYNTYKSKAFRAWETMQKLNAEKEN